MTIKNSIYIGANNRKSLLDLYIPSSNYKGIVVFLHGYKGYKDWGAWNLVAKEFTENKLGFCSFNFSHNGGTVETPIDFPDLEAFAENRYSYELDDVKAIVKWLNDNGFVDKDIHLIGHSRGGGIALLAATENKFNSVTTWASVADFEERFPIGKELEQWENEGVRYVENKRTSQNMPHKYSFYTDFLLNKDRLSISKATKTLKENKTPCLHIHGENDEAVEVEAVNRIANNTGGKSIIISNTNHTFDSKHPYEKEKLPKALAEVVQHTLKFIKAVK